ncbi:MAG: MBL fold metallo-hydrolase [Cumulibacter sp.]
MAARVEHLITSGTFSLDGGTWEVDNNVWILGDDASVIVLDAPHDADAIMRQIGDRKIEAIVCTHAHDDHVAQAPRLRELSGAPILLHRDDRELWALTHPDAEPDGELVDGQVISVAGTDLQVMHTPGHAPGAICLYAADLGCVFTGDTLFNGGPGATGRSFSDYPTIVDSIRARLLTLPPSTVVHTGHGDDTTIGAELGNVPDEKSE